MKYGESTFDILYLLFVIISGIYILFKSKDNTGKLMGLAALVLGIGDSFHLIPRVLNYFMDSDLSMALGIGKFITSVTMTVFYVILFYIWKRVFKKDSAKSLEIAVLVSAAIRIALCLFPQNGWLQNSNDMTWGIIRNVPFVILGAIICWIFFTARKEDRIFKPMWLLILLSFAFYMPVAIAAGIVPLLGMLMIPKTVCYILMVVTFIRKHRVACSV